MKLQSRINNVKIEIDTGISEIIKVIDKLRNDRKIIEKEKLKCEKEFMKCEKELNELIKKYI